MKIRSFFLMFVKIKIYKHTNLRVIAIVKKQSGAINPLIFTFIIVKHTN